MSNRGNAELLVVLPLREAEYAGWKSHTKKLIVALHENFRFKLMYLKSCADSSSNSEPNRDSRSGGLSRIIFVASVSRCLLIDKDRIRLIYFPFFFFPSTVIAVIASIMRVKYICRISGSELRMGGKLATSIRYFAIRKAHMVVCLNTNAISTLISLGVCKDRIECIPNGVDTNIFSPPKNYSEKIHIRSHLSLPSDKFVVGYVGSICKRKQTLELIRACATANIRTGSESSITLVIVGPDVGNPEADHDYYDECVNLSKMLGLDAKYFQYTDEIHYFYKSFDLFVLPSLSEGMPNVLLEAMASGLPCLATAIPGVVDIINSAEVGCLFNPESNLDFADKLERLIEDKDLQKILSKNSRMRIVENYSVSTQNALYEKLFKDAEIL